MTLNRLEQEVETNRAMYNLFLAQTRGAQIEQAAQMAESEYKLKIIEPTTKPLHPIGPGKKKIMLIALLFGLAIGLGSIFGLEYFNQTYLDVRTLEKDLNIPILGIMPKIQFTTMSSKRKVFVWKVAIPVSFFLVTLFFILHYNVKVQLKMEK